MKWDVVWFDDETKLAYRIAAKRMTVGDGVTYGTMQDEMILRDEYQGRLMFRMSNEYPLLRFGTRAVECATLEEAPETGEGGNPVIPDNADWQPFDLTEAAFLEMPDLLLWTWVSVVKEKNPQYDNSYESLKKVLSAALLLSPNVALTNNNEASASEPETT